MPNLRHLEAVVNPQIRQRKNASFNSWHTHSEHSIRSEQWRLVIASTPSHNEYRPHLLSQGGKLPQVELLDR